MTTYEHFMYQCEECLKKACEFQDNKNMFDFYTNAAKGFQVKLGNLTLAEAKTEYSA